MEEKMRQIKEMFPNLKNNDILEVFQDSSSNDFDIDKFQALNEKRLKESERDHSNIAPKLKQKEPRNYSPINIAREEDNDKIVVTEAPDRFSKDVLRNEKKEIRSLIDDIKSIDLDLGPLLPDDELDEKKKPLYIYSLFNENQNIISVYFKMKDVGYEDIEKLTQSRIDKNIEITLNLNSIQKDKLIIPAPNLPGEYVFKAYLKKNGIVESNIVHIPRYDKLILKYIDGENLNKKIQKVEVTWDIRVVEVSTKDHLSLCSKSGSGLEWKRAVKNSKSLMFDIPRTPGEYVIKYFSSVMKDIVAISDTIVVPNRDVVSAEYNQEGYILVTWNIYSVDPKPSDWIAIVQKDSDKKYESYQYVPQEKLPLIFKMKGTASNGEYVARYFCKANPSMHLVESKPFKIM